MMPDTVVKTVPGGARGGVSGPPETDHASGPAATLSQNSPETSLWSAPALRLSLLSAARSLSCASRSTHCCWYSCVNRPASTCGQSQFGDPAAVLEPVSAPTRRNETSAATAP